MILSFFLKCHVSNVPEYLSVYAFCGTLSYLILFEQHLVKLCQLDVISWGMIWDEFTGFGQQVDSPVHEIFVNSSTFSPNLSP